MGQKRKGRTLKFRITFMVSLSVFVAILIVMAVNAWVIVSTFQNQIEDKAESASHGIYGVVDEDKLISLLENPKADQSKTYQELYRNLNEAKESVGAAYMYVLMPHDENNYKYFMYMDEEDYQDNPDDVKMNATDGKEDFPCESVFKEGKESTTDMYTYTPEEDEKLGNEKKQYLISSYLPIIDDSGQVVAVFGIDLMINEEFNRLMTMFILFIVISIGLTIVGMIVSIFRTSNMFAPLSHIVDLIQRLSEGDFTKGYEYNKNNEFGQISESLQELVTSLKNMIGTTVSGAGTINEMSASLDESADQIVTGVNEVTDSINSIVQLTDNQSRDSEKGLQQMEILSRVVEDTSQCSEELKSNMDVVNQANTTGIQVVENLLAASKETVEALKIVIENVRLTGESVSKIGIVSETIRGIAEETSLLALNANIEASRAGDAGKGFAVVASEIRKLAEQSNNSTEEIQDIIQMLEQNSKNTMEAMSSMEGISAGQAEHVADTEDKFLQISNAIQGTKNAMDRMASATQELQKMHHEVSAVFENIARETVENVEATEEVLAVVEEVSASMNVVADIARTLNLEAGTLKQSTEQFTL